MTENKPIMIDGIDVSGCEAYKYEHCKDKTSIMFCNTNLCSNFPNCNFKQLSRKTQECEELKEEVQQALKKNAENYSNSCLLQKEVNQLKVENEKLKNIIQKSANGFCNDYVEAIENYDNLKEELAHIQHNCTRDGCKYYDNDDYKVFYRCKAEQKLEQIRQIVNKLSLSINWNINKNAYKKLQSIIHIIDEVE